MPRGHLTGKTFHVNSGGFTTLWELKLETRSSIFIDQSWFVKAAGELPRQGMCFDFTGTASNPTLTRAAAFDLAPPPLPPLPGAAACLHGKPPGGCLICPSSLAPVVPLRRPGTLNIMLTCDWEGREDVLKYYEDMRLLRQKIQKLCHQALPITHFITPRSYETTLLKVIEAGDVVLPVDEIGLHIHCWKDLLAEVGSGVPREGEACRVRFAFTAMDGKDTPLTAFSKEGIQQIVRFCHEKLHKISRVKARSFRGGAWFANDFVYEALAGCGVINDSSPIPLELVNYPDPTVHGAIAGLWGAEAGLNGNLRTSIALSREPVTVTTQPYVITTPGGDLRVFPMTWGMDVNATKEQIVDWFKAECVRVLAGEHRFVNLGFHDTLIQRNWLLEVLTLIWEDLQKIPYGFLTMEQAGKLFVGATERTG